MSRLEYLISCIIFAVVTVSASSVSHFLGLADGSDVAVGIVLISGTAIGVIFNTGIGIMSYFRLKQANRPVWVAFLSIIGLTIVPFIMGLLDDQKSVAERYNQAPNGGTLNTHPPTRVPQNNGQSFQDDF